MVHSARRVRCVDVICRQARQRGVPCAQRSGLFVHGPDLIVDTPEDIIASLAAFVSNILRRGPIPTGIRTICWVRMWESLNGTIRDGLNASEDAAIFWRVAEDVRDRLGIWETFTFLEQRGLIEIIESRRSEFFSNEYQITPVSLAEEYFCPNCGRAWKRLFVAVDELFGWCPSEKLGHLTWLWCLWV